MAGRNSGGQGVGGGTSRKHHKKKRGVSSRGRYALRLQKRGVSSKSVHMRDLDDLRNRAERRAKGKAQEEEQ